MDLKGLVGLTEAGAEARLGRAVTRRVVGDGLWLIYSLPDFRLRVLCRSDRDGSPRVASWTAGFANARDTLEAAARTVGLWPGVAPDQAAAEVSVPLIRRPLPDPAGAIHTFTATVRSGRITHVSVFDEAPDWE